MNPLLQPPAFGDSLPIFASPQTLSFLARRRSASALTLQAPGPDEEEVQALLSLAARVPDHGKVAPWRFIVLVGPSKALFVEKLESLAAVRPDGASLVVKLGKLREPPITIAVISRLVPGKIPEWEQRLSAGAVCAMLIIAGQAMGYGANWITDWYAYDEAALALLGLRPSEKVAGFIHMGTPRDAPLERARPDVTELTTFWRPG